MATLNVSGAKNFHDATFSGRAAGDTYAFTAQDSTLTIDGDTRYGPNTSASTGVIGSLSYNFSGYCSIIIDATNVRLIPYSGGSGNVPAGDTVISRSGVSGKLLGVWSALNAPPTAAGSAMPASGYIKVRQKTGGNYSAGALTGISATATGADVAGWIEVIGLDTGKLGDLAGGGTTNVLDIRGEWFELGTTNGAANQTFQAPASLANTQYPGAYIETGTGTGVFEFWPSAGTVTAVATDDRGKFVWCGSQGLIRIGNNGSATAGRLPAAGRRVVVGNVLIIPTNAATGYTANKAATDTQQMRVEANGGRLLLAKTTFLGPTVGGCASVKADYCAWLDYLTYNAAATTQPSYFRRCGLGCKTGSALAAESMALTPSATMEISDCYFAVRTPSAFLGAVAFRSVDLVTMSRTRIAVLARGVTYVYALLLSDSGGVFEDVEIVGATVQSAYRSTWRRMKYADRISGTQDGSVGINVFTESMPGLVLDGFDWLVSGANTCHPANFVIRRLGSGAKVRNIGSPSAPLDLGTVNACQGLYESSTYIFVDRQIKRVHVQNWSWEPGVNRATLRTVLENVSFMSSGASAGDIAGIIDGRVRGINFPSVGATFQPDSPATGIHSLDIFTSDTAGRILILGRSPTTLSASFCTLSGAVECDGGYIANFRGVGATMIVTTDWLLGHTGFQNTTPLAAISRSNAALDYDIDKGAGFSGTWKSLTGANLSAETITDYTVKGFRLKVRIASITAAQWSYTGFSTQIDTTTTASARYTLYPLDPASITVNGLATGSIVKVSRTDTGAVLFTGSESGGQVSFSADYSGQILVEARKASGAPYYQPWTALATVNGDITVTAVQIRDDQ